jgi:hypothetical protein
MHLTAHDITARAFPGTPVHDGDRMTGYSTGSTVRLSAWRRTAVLWLLFGTAIAIRVYHVTDPLTEFRATRQYRAAMIARAQYQAYDKTMPAWAREIALIDGEQGALEPPIMETLAVWGYRVFRGEHLWIGRSISIVGWLIGGVALHRIGRRLRSPTGNLFGTTVYLLAPFGVLASRSFQPDALMTGATAVALLLVIRFAESRVAGRLLGAALATGIAALIKPMSLFFIFPCFVAVAWPPPHADVGRGHSGPPVGWNLLAWEGWTFLLLSLAPAVAYYAYGLFVTGAMQDEAGGRFLPHLLGTTFFWSGWWNQANRVADTWVWVLAAVGAITCGRGLPRQLLGALWGGYLLYALAFPYHIATHDYYHLPALILASLDTGAAISWLAAGLARVAPPRVATVAGGVLVLMIAAVWVQRSARELRSRNGSADVVMYERIGAILRHSPRTVLLAYDYGAPLRYHGQLTGPTWPSADDLVASTLGAGAGAAEDSAWSNGLSAQARYDRFYRPRRPDYFLITDFESLAAQSDLKPFLEANFPRLAEGPGYLIFDLRGK